VVLLPDALDLVPVVPELVLRELLRPVETDFVPFWLFVVSFFILKEVK
jgi:hypothetical protein